MCTNRNEFTWCFYRSSSLTSSSPFASKNRLTGYYNGKQFCSRKSIYRFCFFFAHFPPTAIFIYIFCLFGIVAGGISFFVVVVVAGFSGGVVFWFHSNGCYNLYSHSHWISAMAFQLSVKSTKARPWQHQTSCTVCTNTKRHIHFNDLNSSSSRLECKHACYFWFSR